MDCTFDMDCISYLGTIHESKTLLETLTNKTQLSIQNDFFTG